MRTLLRIILLGCALMLWEPRAHAQQSPMLTVVLLDEADAGVSGALVTVRSEDAHTTLAQATTDRAGHIEIAIPLPDVVRVAVSGTRPNGTPLRQVGQDAPGVWLRIDGQATQLDLRVEPTGDVIPDPVTMISPDRGIDSVPGAGTTEPALPTVAPSLVGPTPAPLSGQPATVAGVGGFPVRFVMAAGLALVGAALFLVALGKRGTA